ncbi:hypothetical protein C364_06197 [Cryptococcus neoformans Bt63]|nr:hypothetical protein C364_06197 [Cryptococcus neoformans var. grubii Bt63]
MTGALSAAQVSVTSNYDEFEFEENFDREELEKAMHEAEHRYEVPSENANGRAVRQPAESQLRVRDIEDIVPDQVDKGSLPSQRSVTPLVYAEHAEQIELEELEKDGEAEDSLAPFLRFRKRGFFNVTDLAAPVWCETQYDYRLRTLPFLPLAERPDVITATSGKQIVVDKKKREGGERIMSRGRKVHKRLEREIHPDEVVVNTTTREDVWGLRFLNMLSAVEALLTIGKCREMPVVGFINDIMVLGIIDEIIRSPIEPPKLKASKSTTPSKSPSNISHQTSLAHFFTSIKHSQVVGQTPSVDLPLTSLSQQSRPRTHKLYISDSKTRAVLSVPQDDDTKAGKIQVMMYKEMLDAILLAPYRSNTPPSTDQQPLDNPFSVLPSRASEPFAWKKLFDHLSLSPTEPFSEQFFKEGRMVIKGNKLRHGANEALCLQDFVQVWEKYVEDLGLGYCKETKLKDIREKGEEWENLGKTEDRLELVYRWAGGKKKRKRGEARKRRKKGSDRESPNKQEDPLDGEFQGGEASLNRAHGHLEAEEEQRLIRLAIAESLNMDTDVSPTTSYLTTPTLTPPYTIPVLHANPASMSRKHKEDRAESTAQEDEEYWTSTDDEFYAHVIESGLSEERAGGDSFVPGSVGTIPNGAATNNPTIPTSKVPFASTPSNPKSSYFQSPLVPSTPSKKPSGVHTSQLSALISQEETKTKTKSKDYLVAGSIIGRSAFSHSPKFLADHLKNVLQFWMGERPPKGVEIHEAKRCAYCEFEDGCEWRLMKVEEHHRQVQERKNKM